MLADALPSPDAGQMFTVMVGIGAMMTFYWLGRQIYLSHFPLKTEPKENERFVTHAFLDQRLLELKNDVSSKLQENKVDVSAKLQENKVEMTRLEQSVRDLDREFGQKLEKQEHYLHESFHRIGGSQNTVQNDMSYMRGVMEAMIKTRRRRPTVVPDISLTKDKP